MNLRLSASANGTRNILEGGGVNLREKNIFSPNPSIDPSTYYQPGLGNPAVSTADYYQVAGLYGFRPWDLLAMGSEGATLAATYDRYVWLTTPDHPNGNNNWIDSNHALYVGFSSDPRVYPTSFRKLVDISNLFTYNTGSGTQNFRVYQLAWLVYNPDAAGDKFWVYMEGYIVSGTDPLRLQHMTGVVTTADFLTATLAGPSHMTTAFGGWSSFQHVFRNGVDDWVSVGLRNPTTYDDDGRWTATDPMSFTSVDPKLTVSIGSRYFNWTGSWSDPITISSLRYMPMMEEESGRRYFTLVAIDSDYNVLGSPSPIRLTDAYGGVTYLPGPKAPNMIASYAEDGVLFFNVSRGFPPSESTYTDGEGNPLVAGATYANGGGLWEQFVDSYSYVFDAALAVEAAPSGLAATCSAGVVTLTWDDILPNNTYRVYRGTDSATQADLIGDVTGGSATDTPTVDTHYWYKVVTMEGATERGSRVVDIYASAGTAFVNKHITRVLNDGGSGWDATHLSDADAMLTANDWHKYLLWWPDPAFGYKTAGDGTLVVYCLGTTRVPSRGDYRSSTSATTRSATGLNSTAPAWVNANNNSFGYFGDWRINNIRRKTQFTVFAAYQKADSNTATLLGSGEQLGTQSCMQFSHTSGGNVTFMMTGSGGFAAAVTASVAISGHTSPHVIAGTYDGSTLTAYADGVAGTGQSLAGTTDVSAKHFLKGQPFSDATAFFLGSGAATYKISAGSRAFGGNQAKFSCSGLPIFEKSFSGAEVTTFTNFYKNWGGF
jgi:hypothetical protein